MKYFLLTLIFSWITLSGYSQEQETLSLSDAIQVGLANNFDIQVEELNVEIAKNNNNWGAAGRWPTIS